MAPKEDDVRIQIGVPLIDTASVTWDEELKGHAYRDKMRILVEDRRINKRHAHLAMMQRRRRTIKAVSGGIGLGFLVFLMGGFVLAAFNFYLSAKSPVTETVTETETPYKEGG